MTEQTKRRLDQILEAGFVKGLGAASTEELESRKRACAAEEADISYSRRILQGKLDILKKARAMRSEGSGEITSSLVDQLPSILADSGGPKGQLRHMTLDGPKKSSGRRQGDRLAGSVADLDRLSPEELSAQIEKLTEAEQQASMQRKRVHEVIDRIDAELVARLRDR